MKCLMLCVGSPSLITLSMRAGKQRKVEKNYSWCTSTRSALPDDGVRYSKGVGIETELTMGKDAGFCDDHA